ncbi:MAG: DUF6356 family protein [Betaproteobacteria bacterium]
MNVLRAFVAHPASVGESYFQHLWVAASFGVAMIGGGLACLVHAILPFTFVKRGSATIAHLHERMVTHRVADRTPVPRRADADVS